MTEETWRDVEGFEDTHEVSSLGRIKAKERPIRSKRSRSGYRLKKEKILSFWDQGNGYWMVDLSKEGETSSFLVHRIVALAFIENEERKPMVNHKDGNKKNNSSSNLEWATREENEIHATESGLKARGERNGANKRAKVALSRDDVAIIRRRAGDGTPQKEIAKDFNICPSRVSSIVKRKVWSPK